MGDHGGSRRSTTSLACSLKPALTCTAICMWLVLCLGCKSPGLGEQDSAGSSGVPGSTAPAEPIPRLSQAGVFPVARIVFKANTKEQSIESFTDAVTATRRFRYSFIVESTNPTSSSLLVETDHALTDEEFDALHAYAKESPLVDRVERLASNPG